MTAAEIPEKRWLDALRAFLENPTGMVEVGRLHEAARVALAAVSADVFLSAATMAKQRREHPELSADDYLTLPAVLETPDLILQWEELRVAVLRGAQHDRVAVVKCTMRRHENYVVSFRRSERKDMQRMLRKSRLVFGSLEGWSRR
jgi:hypothetical protein